LGRILMSDEERKRVEVMARVKKRDLRLRDAAEMLGISYRQAKRIRKRYRKQGAKGLVHGSVGRKSNRAKPKKFRDRALRLVREKYSGEIGERFGPTLAAEHLSSEDGVEVGTETLRQWMLAEGLWSRERKHKAHRKRRERKAHFGELVQMDGSFEDWLEGRGPYGCLMNMVDDATSTTVCRLGEQETIWAAAGVLRMWIEKYGVPLALYTDWKNVYVREPTTKELLRGEVAVTQFGGMCGRLGIRIIAAGSAQAKGRVERNHGTHQDRLIKKMRRKRIATHAGANEFLATEYLGEHNGRFAVAAAQPQDYHRAAPRKAKLDEVFRLETERTIGQDWVVRHDNRFFQVTRESGYAPARAKVVVCEWEDARLEIRYRDQRLGFEEIPARPEKPQKPECKSARHRRPAPPTSSHPWRKGYQKMRARSAKAS
jgi:transposase